MKFSEIKKEDWLALKPYLDTCLLPVTGLNGSESPVEAAERLEQLRDVLDLLERPYRGRTVTYPALHYTEAESEAQQLVADVVGRIREAGFRYVIIVTIIEAWEEMEIEGADLVITPNSTERISDLISSLWA